MSPLPAAKTESETSAFSFDIYVYIYIDIYIYDLQEEISFQTSFASELLCWNTSEDTEEGF